jgi:hypothetical protein
VTELPTTPPPSATTPSGEPSPTPHDPPAAGSSTPPRIPADGGPALPPDISWDETDEGWSERPDPSDDDRIRGEVPPHHVG